MSFTTRVLGTFGARGSTTIIAVVVSIVIARSLGPEGKGVFTLAILILTVLVALSSLGMGASNNYYSASGKHRLNALVGNSLVLASVIGLLVPVAFLLFWHLSPFKLLPEVSPTYVYIVLAAVPFSLLNSYLNGILVGKLKIRQINLIGIFNGLVYLLGVVVLLLVLKQSLLSIILLTCGVRVIPSLLYMVMIK